MSFGQLEFNNCFYCEQYAKHIHDYPMNSPSLFLEGQTPRCYLHGQYVCDTCKNPRHFNGISWCPNCKKFTCVRCGEEKVNPKKFLVYGYHYKIKCIHCDQWVNTLEIAEFEGKHPFQVGDIRPKFDIMVWYPLTMIQFKNLQTLDEAITNESISGRKRIQDMIPTNHGKSLAINSEGSLQTAISEQKQNPERDNPIMRWSIIAEHYHEKFKQGGDWHHRELIIPYVMKLLNPASSDKILDLGCGDGNLCKLISSKCAKVVGVDPSDMIDFATTNGHKNIVYHKSSIQSLNEVYPVNYFDKVISNMVLMDIPDDEIETTVEMVAKLLKTEGIFVFSILHPCFDPVSRKTMKVPFDSEKNTDRIYLQQNYLKHDIKKIEVIAGFPTFHFHRPLSFYSKLLSRHGFAILEIEEPIPDENQIRMFPREIWNDYDEAPLFLYVKAILLK